MRIAAFLVAWLAAVLVAAWPAQAITNSDCGGTRGYASLCALDGKILPSQSRNAAIVVHGENGIYFSGTVTNTATITNTGTATVTNTLTTTETATGTATASTTATTTASYTATETASASQTYYGTRTFDSTAIGTATGTSNIARTVTHFATATHTNTSVTAPLTATVTASATGTGTGTITLTSTSIATSSATGTFAGEFTSVTTGTHTYTRSTTATGTTTATYTISQTTVTSGTATGTLSYAGLTATLSASGTLTNTHTATGLYTSSATSTSTATATATTTDLRNETTILMPDVPGADRFYTTGSGACEHGSTFELDNSWVCDDITGVTPTTLVPVALLGYIPLVQGSGSPPVRRWVSAGWVKYDFWAKTTSAAQIKFFLAQCDWTTGSPELSVTSTTTVDIVGTSWAHYIGYASIASGYLIPASKTMCLQAAAYTLSGTPTVDFAAGGTSGYTLRVNGPWILPQ